MGATITIWDGSSSLFAALLVRAIPPLPPIASRQCITGALSSCCHGDVGQSADVQAPCGFEAGSRVKRAQTGAHSKFSSECRSGGFSRAAAVVQGKRESKGSVKEVTCL